VRSITKQSEHTEQVLIFKWAALQSGKYPCLKFMYSTLNGIRLSIGSAVKAKASGNKRGLPDIVLPYRNKTYTGLYLELKFGKNKPSKEQKEYMEYLNTQGYLAVWKIGSKEAIDLIKEYLEN